MEEMLCRGLQSDLLRAQAFQTASSALIQASGGVRQGEKPVAASTMAVEEAVEIQAAFEPVT